MGYFRRDDRGGGGGRDRGGFGRRFGGGGGRDRESRQMFHAVCSNCGKDCEVPFQPTGSKPVYCSDCFEKMGGRDQPSRRFDDRGPRRSSFEPRNDDRGQNNEKFNELNAKLDKILLLLQPKIEEEIAPKKKEKAPKKTAKSSEDVKSADKT